MELTSVLFLKIGSYNKWSIKLLVLFFNKKYKLGMSFVKNTIHDICNCVM